MRRYALAASLGSMLACDPAAGVSARVTLAPAPMRSCPDSVLAASPLVDSIRPHVPSKDGVRLGRRYIEVWFPQDSVAVWWAGLQIALKPDSVARIELSFGWMGTLDSYTQAERATMARIARSLVESISSACARPAVDAVICAQGGWGSTGRKRTCGAAT